MNSNELNYHIKNTPLAFASLDKNLCIINWSDKAEKITGYKKDEVLGKKILSLDWYADQKYQDRAQERLGKIVAGDVNKYHEEIKIYNKKSEVIDIRVYCSAYREKSTGLKSIFYFFEDVTTEKKQGEKYRKLFERANDGILLTKEEKFVDCNKEMTKIFDCSKSDIIGKTPTDFSPELQYDGTPSTVKAKSKIKAALNGVPQVFDWLHQTPQGDLIDTEVSLNRLDLSDGTYIITIIRNITKQQKVEREFKKSEQLFNTLFLKSPFAMCMVDPENRVKIINNSFEKLFGYSQQEIKGKNIDSFILPDIENEIDNPSDIPKEGKVYNHVVRSTKENEIIDCTLAAIPVYVENKLVAGIATYSDISQQKEIQQKLKSSLKEKQVLLSEIHHRVNNNLAVITSLLQLERYKTDNKETIKTLSENESRIFTIGKIHELLYQAEDFANIDIKPYIIELVDYISEKFSLDKKNIEINLAISSLEINANQALPLGLILVELLTNLITNAIKSEKSESILIEVKRTEKDFILKVKVNDKKVTPSKLYQEDAVGHKLIETLQKQLNASLEIDSNNETVIRLNFEKNQAKGSVQSYSKNN